MRIALINLILTSVDRPEKTAAIFGASPTSPLETDTDIHIVKLTRGLARLGHQVTLFIADTDKPCRISPDSPRLQKRYLKTRWRWLFPPAYLPFTPSLYREIRHGQFDVIQSNDLFLPATIIAALACKHLLVWQEVDRYPTRPLARFIAKLFYHSIGRLISKRILFVARSSSAAEFLQSMAYPRLIGTLHTGVDAKIFKHLGLKEEYLLVVSRLAGDKGWDFLLEAFREIHGKRPDIRLLIKGDGPRRSALIQQISRLNLDNAISVETQKSSHQEMNFVYNRAYLTLIPGWGGLLPFTCYESLAAGRPVVSRFGRGLQDIVIEEQTGFITPTPQAMAEKVLWLLNHPKERDRMGRAGSRLMQDYDLDRIAEKFVEHYKKIAEKENHG